MKYKLIYIEWEDAHSTASWLTEGEMLGYFDEKSYGASQSIGWLIKEDKNWIMLASRLGSEIGDSDTSYGMIQKIPAKWITKRKILK